MILSAEERRCCQMVYLRSSATSADENLQALFSRDLDPLFWTPRLIGKESAWWTHVPFAFWVMAACRPRLFVELGTHRGVSYAAFCEATLRARTGSQCYAIDSWAGDHQAGYYGEQVYTEFRSFHDQHYAAFSELLRSSFDEAQPHFADGSIDLLHIDGLHTYEAVKHDFEFWRPKLSDRAVVLFHDTNVRRGDFGVYCLFAELVSDYPSFEFLHGYGLGLIVVGAAAPAVVKALCAIDDPAAMSAVRKRFFHLGARWDAMTREQLRTSLKARLKRRVLRMLGKWGRRLEQVPRANAIRRSLYFDRHGPFERNPDVAAAGIDTAPHDALDSGAEGRDPGPLFSVRQYPDGNPGIAHSATHSITTRCTAPRTGGPPGFFSR